MFTVLCCADLYGEKVNLEVTLPCFPASLATLEDALYRVFQGESLTLARGVTNQTPFRVASIQWYDDEQRCWTELLGVQQLSEYDQLYIFQPQTRLHHDVQQDLPPPRPPLTQTSSIGVRAYQSASHSGTPDNSHMHSTSRQRPTGELSPSARKLAEKSREESSLLDRLRLLREEKAALERSAETEMEEERRQLAAETDAALRRKEAEIWQQRDSLAKAEHDFQALLERKQQIVSARSSRATQH